MKKLLSLLLAFIMVISVFVVVPTSVSAATYNYLFPVNNGGKIAYVYGYSSAYGSSFHTGIDIHSNGDDNIYAATGGTVVATANSCTHVSCGYQCEHYSTYGNYIKIKNNDGTYAYYGHLKKDGLKVSTGATVTKGQAIAVMGSSGYSTGKHLHFEVRLSDGSTKVNVNPTSNGGSVNYSYSGYGIPTPSFTYTSISTGKYYLKHNATGKYMNVSYGTDANKQNVDLYDGFYTAEVMNIISTSYGYKMRPECCTSRVINAWGDNPSSGANVNIYDDTSDSTQSWKFQAVSGGYIIHNAYNTSLVLDNNNGNVCINTYTGGSSQIWSLVPYHTHNYNTHSHYGSEHPHYEYLKCSCGATQVNTSKTSLKDGCDQCYPAMPVLNVRAGSDAEYVQFYWDATKNTDSYDLPIYDAKTGDRLYFFTGIETLNYQVKLPAGEYIASLASINSDLYDSGADRWYTYGSRVPFTVTTGDFNSSAESIVDGKRYELFNIAMPWTEAKAKCEELGGHLVTITSQEEADIVNSLVAEGGRTNYWLGLSDNETEGQWKNVTDESIAYSNWGTDEPNNYLGVENHATIIQDSFMWNDVMNMYGSYSLGFICEYENNIEEIEIILEDGENYIPVSWTKIPDAVKYEFVVTNVSEKKIKEDSTINSLQWVPIDDFLYENIEVSVRAYDSKGLLVGESTPEIYRIVDALADWWGVCGDANLDTSVNIKDATAIQKYIAGLETFDEMSKIAAEVNGDSNINIKDATAIQKYIAGITVDSNIGDERFCSWQLFSVGKPESYESDWVLASQVPEGAEIVDEKWIYDLTTRTTSDSSTAPDGYSQYKEPTWEWGPYGPWSEWSRTVYTASDSRQVENKYYAATTKTVWKYSRDVSSDGKLSTYSLGYYGNIQNITLDYRLGSTGTVDGHTRYGSYNGGYGTYLQNYWWNESQTTEEVTPAYYMYRYRDRSKVYTYYYHKVESKESETEILPSDTISNVQKWVKYLEF